MSVCCVVAVIISSTFAHEWTIIVIGNTRCSREREMPCLTSEYKLNPWGGEGATRAREVSYNDEGNRVGSNQQRCNLKDING